MGQNLFEDKEYQSTNLLLDFFLTSVKNLVEVSLSLEKLLSFGFHQQPK